MSRGCQMSRNDSTPPIRITQRQDNNTVNFAQLIAAAERELAAAEATRAGHLTEQTALMATLPDESASLSKSQAARFAELSTAKAAATLEIDAKRAQIASLKKEMADDERMTKQAEQRTPGATAPQRGPGPAVVGAEARTYTVETSRRGVSFFSDTYRAQFKADFQARERLERHGREVVIEHETRAIGTDGIGGLIIPQYLTDMLVMPNRNGRVFADQATNLALPVEGNVLQIPRWTSGVTVTSQDGENTNVSNTDIVDDTDLLINVRTIAGEQDLSRQVLERGTAGVDQLVYADLVEAYMAQIGNQVINGSGANNTHLGVRNTAGIPSSTAFAAALTAANYAIFSKKIAGAIASVASGQRAANEPPLQANLITMHPRRWGWITSLTAADGRPLVNTVYNGPQNVFGLNLNPGAQSLGEGSGGIVVGQINGLPVVTDANIPTNVGTLSEDIVIVSDKSKMLLWEEGDGTPREIQYDQAAASKLQVKLQVYGYSAFTAGRRLTATAIVGGKDTVAGNGLIEPALF